MCYATSVLLFIQDFAEGENMGKTFNVSAACRKELHYMVDISDKLSQIKEMVDRGEYFTINRARQYGKTTTLRELKKMLKKR